MRRRIIALFLGSITVSCATSPAARNKTTDPPELQAAIAQVREWRMTAMAYNQLRTVAALITGDAVMTFPRDEVSGEYGRGMKSTSCMLPTADSTAADEWRREFKSRVELVIPELRTLADTDTSGFVTDVEAGRLRELLEFGYFVDFLSTVEHAELSAVATATHLDVEEVLKRAREYNAAAARVPKCAGCEVPLLALQ